MWVMTTRGFFSAVQKTGDPLLTVRARNKGDIDNLALMIDRTPTRKRGTDYAWRLRCTHAEWTQALANMALDIDYSNFKDEVKKRQGPKRASVYSRVWGVLLDLEDRRRGGGFARQSAFGTIDDEPGWWNDYGRT